MNLNFYSLLKKNITKTFVLSCVVLLTAIAASAQHRKSAALTYGGGGNGDINPNGWGLSLSAGYDGTTGDMRSTYKGAPAYSFSMLHNWNGFTFNTTIGYVSYHPKQDTSFIYAGDTQAGYIQYGNFRSLEFFVGGAYNISIADAANLYLGVNIGSYYNSFDVDAVTDAGTYSYSSNSSTQFVSPKLGFNFIIDDHFTFGLEGRYNLQFGSKSTDTDGYSYGISNIKTYTVSGVLSYYF